MLSRHSPTILKIRGLVLGLLPFFAEPFHVIDVSPNYSQTTQRGGKLFMR